LRHADPVAKHHTASDADAKHNPCFDPNHYSHLDAVSKLNPHFNPNTDSIADANFYSDTACPNANYDP
jgi:hypothetical protein